MRDLVGRTLGHHRVVDLIGIGGMGVVYRARDERLDREVAIKVLSEEIAGEPERLLRFEREARAAAALNHPNILASLGRIDEAFELFEEAYRQRLPQLVLWNAWPQLDSDQALRNGAGRRPTSRTLRHNTDNVRYRGSAVRCSVFRK